MTAQGEDLLAWLGNAIKRVETVARAATERQPYDEWDAVGDDRDGDTARKYWSVVGIAQMNPTPAARDLATHIALHDPASVLRRCAADRTLLELHAQDSLPNGIDLDECRTCGGVNEPWPCPTLLAIAEGYGWTGGEQ